MAIQPNKDLRTELGHQIWMLRRQKNMTQMTLADIIGISYQQIQKYEYGTSSLTVERLFQICDALDMKPADFIALVNTAIQRDGR